MRSNKWRREREYNTNFRRRPQTPPLCSQNVKKCNHTFNWDFTLLWVKEINIISLLGMHWPLELLKLSDPTFLTFLCRTICKPFGWPDLSKCQAWLSISDLCSAETMLWAKMGGISAQKLKNKYEISSLKNSIFFMEFPILANYMAKTVLPNRSKFGHSLPEPTDCQTQPDR